MNYKELFKNITTVVLDVDGVLTNGEVLLMPGMAPVRKMHSKDGYAIHSGLLPDLSNASINFKRFDSFLIFVSEFV